MRSVHQDVLDWIADYACSSVAEACTLRRVCSSYRMAADNNVRMLAAKGQPEIVAAVHAAEGSPAEGSPAEDVASNAATLVLDRFQMALDDARHAFHGCPPTAIVKLIVVAFALGGAKGGPDTAEAAWCGPRPVKLVGFPDLQRPIDPRLQGTAALGRVLQRYMINLDLAAVGNAEALEKQSGLASHDVPAEAFFPQRFP